MWHVTSLEHRLSMTYIGSNNGSPIYGVEYMAITLTPDRHTTNLSIVERAEMISLLILIQLKISRISEKLFWKDDGSKSVCLWTESPSQELEDCTWQSEPATVQFTIPAAETLYPVSIQNQNTTTDQNKIASVQSNCEDLTSNSIK